MAHLVQSMFSVREVPWHGLGKIVNEAPTAEEAIKLAGLNWKVNEEKIHYGLGSINGVVGKVDMHKPIEGYKALVRSDNEHVLSVMKNSYSVLQNEDAFKFFNPFIESGLASFQTAGSLKEGKVVWILATLNKAPIEIGKGDVVNKHLLLSNSHDGQMAVRVGFTPIRVVCNNTLSMAVKSSRSQLLRIKHKGNMADRMSEVQEIVNAFDAKFEATAEQYKALSKKNVNKKDLEKYVTVLFELNHKGTEREQMRAKKMTETILRLFENGAGQHLKTAKGTAWGMYNAVTEYLTHEYGKEEENRLYGNWFGDLSRKNEKALELALERV